MDKVLVVVDAQNDFISGPLGSEEAMDVVYRIVDKIKDYEGIIILTMDTHHKNYLETREGRHLPVKHCIEFSPGWYVHTDIIKAVSNNPYRYVSHTVLKNTFGSKDLVELIPKDVSEIELIGYDLDICVISNALLLKAYYPEADIVVDTKCCAATSPEAFEAAVTILSSCQIDIR